MNKTIIKICLSVFSMLTLVVPVNAQQTPQASPFDGLPAGKGQIETFAFCSSCHSMMIVKQQRLSLEDWDETLEWMVEEQGMDELPEDIRPQVLAYLAEHFGVN